MAEVWSTVWVSAESAIGSLIIVFSLVLPFVTFFFIPDFWQNGELLRAFSLSQALADFSRSLSAAPATVVTSPVPVHPLFSRLSAQPSTYQPSQPTLSVAAQLTALVVLEARQLAALAAPTSTSSAVLSAALWTPGDMCRAILALGGCSSVSVPTPQNALPPPPVAGSSATCAPQPPPSAGASGLPWRVWLGLADGSIAEVLLSDQDEQASAPSAGSGLLLPTALRARMWGPHRKPITAFLVRCDNGLPAPDAEALSASSYPLEPGAAAEQQPSQAVVSTEEQDGAACPTQSPPPCQQPASLTICTGAADAARGTPASRTRLVVWSVATADDTEVDACGSDDACAWGFRGIAAERLLGCACICHWDATVCRRDAARLHVLCEVRLAKTRL